MNSSVYIFLPYSTLRHGQAKQKPIKHLIRQQELKMEMEHTKKALNRTVVGCEDNIER
jgi:hypothetical protein